MGSNQIPKYIRYVPAQDGAQPKIIRMVEAQKDPMEPSRFRINQKVPVAPPSPPAPVMHSPPRKITAQEQNKWKIPPCVSSWKNPRGYVVPLDKRCAFNGRTNDEPEQINHKFAQLSETLYIANRQHREMLEERMKAERLMALKEKEKTEENLRLLAEQARHERGNIQRGLAHYRSGDYSDGDDEDERIDSDGERERIRIRDQRHRERVRNVNIKASNPARRTRLDREKERDISEQIALGMARPNGDLKNGDDEDLHDKRLFTQSEGLDDGFGHEDDYTVYDKPWKSQASFSTNYRPSDSLVKELAADDDDDERGKIHSKSGNGSRSDQDLLVPIQFEKEKEENIEDIFNVESFLRNAKYNANKMMQQESSTTAIISSTSSKPSGSSSRNIPTSSPTPPRRDTLRDRDRRDYDYKDNYRDHRKQDTTYQSRHSSSNSSSSKRRKH